MLKTRELPGGFRPLGPHQGSALDPRAAGDFKRSPDPLPNLVPLTSNPGSAPVYIIPNKYIRLKNQQKY